MRNSLMCTLNCSISKPIHSRPDKTDRALRCCIRLKMNRFVWKDESSSDNHSAHAFQSRASFPLKCLLFNPMEVFQPNASLSIHRQVSIKCNRFNRKLAFQLNACFPIECEHSIECVFFNRTHAFNRRYAFN